MAKIYVGCKLPHGLRCEVVVEGQKDPKVFNLKGQWLNSGNGAPAILQGYGVTQVDEDLYLTWAAQNADSDVIKGGYVFEDTTAAKVASAGEERSDLKTGLEQLDQSAPAPGVEVRTEG